MRVLVLLFLTLGFALVQAQFPHEGRHNQKPVPGSPWLGIYVKWMEKETAAQLKGVPEGFGLLVREVEPSSPAAQAGLEALDVIWKYDDQLVASKKQLYALIRRTGIGAEAVLTVARAGEELELPVQLGKRPENPEQLVFGAERVLATDIPGLVSIEKGFGPRSGYIKEGDVVVSVVRAGPGFKYSKTEGEKVLEEEFLANEEPSLWPEIIDEKTQRKLQALIESIQKVEREQAPAPRKPRVRRVPVPSE